MTSDLFAGAVGAGFSGLYRIGSPGYMAARAVLISSVARVISESSFGGSVNMSADAKNQLVVAVANAIDSYRGKGSPMKGAVTGVSIDLIANEVMKLIGMTNTTVVGNIGK